MNKKFASLFFCVFLLFLVISMPAYANSAFDSTLVSLNTSNVFRSIIMDAEEIIITTPSSVNISFPTKEQEEITPTEPLNIIPTKPVKITNPPTKIVKPPLSIQSNNNILFENFINNKKLKSSSNYLVWVNTNTQRIYVFSRSKYIWSLSKTFICTTGKDSTPTIKGIFKTQGKAYFVFDKKYNCYLKYVTRIYKGYLFHSVILNKYGEIIDGTLGEKKSHGCIRLSLKDSKWLYESVPIGTTIFIN